MIILTWVKVLVCIVETCICRITLSINGLGPVRNPIRSLCKYKNILKILLYIHIKCHVQNIYPSIHTDFEATKGNYECIRKRKTNQFYKS